METETETKTKYCPGCEQTLSVDEFSKDQRSKAGLQVYCKGCCINYYKQNRDKLTQRSRDYHKTNRGRISQQHKEYQRKNSDKIRQQKKEYYEQNRDEILRRNKNYTDTVDGHLRVAFSNIKRRCTSFKGKDYKNYGGRGIQNKFTSSEGLINYVINVLQIDPRGLEIHRIDNDGNYEVGNIVFLTPERHGTIHAELRKLKKAVA